MKIKHIKRTTVLLLSASLVSGMCIISAAADNTVSSGTQETTSEQESMTPNIPGDSGGQKPDGHSPEMPNGEKPDGQPPEMPNGEKPDGQPPEMPNGQKTDGEPPAKPDGQIPGGQGQMGERETGVQGKTEGQIGSWSMGGTDASSLEGDDYAYDSALYITSEGIDEEKSSTDRIEGGTYEDTSARGITISDDVSGHNGILVDNAEYSITDASINLLTDADGTDTCDFSGKGTAVAA